MHKTGVFLAIFAAIVQLQGQVWLTEGEFRSRASVTTILNPQHSGSVPHLK